MIRVLDLERGPERPNSWRMVALPLVLLLVAGAIGGLAGGTLTGESARAAGAPSMEVDVVASTAEAAGSGGRVVFTYRVTNTSPDTALELIELSDDLLGELNRSGTCSLPQTIEVGGGYACDVEVDIVDRAGSVITTTMIAMAFADDGTELVGTSSTTVTATEHARLVIDYAGRIRSDTGPLDPDDELLTIGDDSDDEGGSEPFDDPSPAVLGTSVDLVGPPEPIACEGGVEWRAPQGLHMGAFRSATLSVDTMLTLDPGAWAVEDLVLHDADIDRPHYPQADERLRIEFWKDEALVAATASTSDLIDGPVSAWSRGGLGSVELPNGADRVLLVHSNEFDGTRGTNSFEPHSLCLTPRVSPDPAVGVIGDDHIWNDDPDMGIDEGFGAPEIDFTIVIENMGDVPVFGLAIADLPVDDLNCDGRTDGLAAGRTLRCSGSRLATPDEVLYGLVQSTIRVDTLQTLPRTASTKVALPAIG